MNYVVLDLEWNQSPYGKNDSIEDLPFEIIEIGAVKLDGSLNVVDSFDGLVKPQVYDEMHSKISEITRFNMKELKEKGRYFEEVIKDFLEWCGEDYMFCTWGTQDLTELQKNIKFYNLPYKFPLPFKYLDIQKLFSIRFEDGKIRSSLEKAVEVLKIKRKDDFHHALSDVKYTVKVMKKIKFDGIIERNFSIDLLKKPSNKKQEIYVVYDNYSKYITRLFSSKERAIADREVRTVRCYECQKLHPDEPCKVNKLENWFSDNSKVYYYLGECETHGFIKGKIRMKKTDDDRVYVVKTVKLTDMEGASEVYQKQLAIRERRRRRRQSTLNEDIIEGEINDEKKD